MNNNYEAIKSKLMDDPDGTAVWACAEEARGIRYDCDEVAALRMTTMEYSGEDDDSVYLILILPGDEPGSYDAWMRRMGENEMSHLYHGRAADLHEMQHKLLLHLPECLGVE